MITDACRAFLAAADVVDEWARHYPPDIFIEPPAGQHGQTVDACSASALRAVLPKIAREIRELVLAEDDMTDDTAYRALLAAAEHTSVEAARLWDAYRASKREPKARRKWELACEVESDAWGKVKDAARARKELTR